MWKSCIIKSDSLVKVIEHEKNLVKTKKTSITILLCSFEK